MSRLMVVDKFELVVSDNRSEWHVLNVTSQMSRPKCHVISQGFFPETDFVLVRLALVTLCR